MAPRHFAPIWSEVFFYIKYVKILIIGGNKMIDINIVRNNPELVKENIKKKFQEFKLPLVDEVISIDKEYRELKVKADTLRGNRNSKSEEIGSLMREKRIEDANKIKEEVASINKELELLEIKEEELSLKIKDIMMKIPNIIDDSVPIGTCDCDNVEVKKYGDPIIPTFEIPYHSDIMEKLNGLDLDSARRISGNGFYFLIGNIARLHSAILTYARDFMINKGFTYVIPPFMIRGDVVNGVMSFNEMDAMMYKIEGEDLYLIGTSEHSMIGKFKDTLIDSKQLPYALTSYSPCFRKEKGAHGIEERGVYRIHQFEKQEMIVICEPNESKEWFEKMYNYTVEFFRTLDIPVRTLECCSGDLADLKSKSIDVEAWSPRQQKYFEVGSCSNLTDAQSRRLGIRINNNGEKYYAHTLNNTVVAPPRMLISFLENNYNEDGSVNIPEVLRPYMGGLDKLS
jgi:seryl-tRNA synthetase